MIGAEVGPTREGMDLIGQIVMANVDAAAYTNDLLQRNLESQIDQYAELFADVYDAINAIPLFARPANLDRLIGRLQWARDDARERMEANR